MKLAGFICVVVGAFVVGNSTALNGWKPFHSAALTLAIWLMITGQILIFGGFQK